METKHRGPVKGTKYSRSGSDIERGWMTYREIGEIESISVNRVMVIINGALGKVAGCVFEDMHGRRPTGVELNDLIKDEDFQEAVAHALEAGGGCQKKTTRK